MAEQGVLYRDLKPTNVMFTAAGRLAFFDGSVTDEAAWAGLSEKHGSAFTHVVSGAAGSPRPASRQAGLLTLHTMLMAAYAAAFIAAAFYAAAYDAAVFRLLFIMMLMLMLTGLVLLLLLIMMLLLLLKK